jgi:hypothetical protein
MRDYQSHKVEYGEGNKVFFFAHSFKSGYQHAKSFIERNKDKYDNIVLFCRNESDFGPTWLQEH